LEQGANLKLVGQFLKVLKQDYQIDLFHQLLNSAVYRRIHGHPILFCYLILPQMVNGIAGIVEKVFEVENTDALFGVISFEKENRTLLIGRSQKDEIDVHKVMKPWGGGGHSRAGSATVKRFVGNQIYDDFIESLEKILQPAVNVETLMTRDVICIKKDWTVLQASMFLEKHSHTGAPVVDDLGNLAGLLTLRDISKARKVSQMKSKVTGYMIHKVYNCTLKTTMGDLERIFLNHNVGHIPVLDQGKVVGIITRSDYLRYMG
jgi:tRNA nucleotidyltransferase (CCA-adding enzyme)